MSLEPPVSSARDAAPDGVGQGQAALFLVESLIHGLVARSILTVVEAVDIMEIALDAQVAVVDAAAGPSLGMREAVTVLSGLVGSLRLDLAE